MELEQGAYVMPTGFGILHHESSEQMSGDIAYRRAWWSLLGFVPSLIAAFVVGEGLYSLLKGSGDAEWWVVLVAAPPALILFVVPGWLAWHFGQRAARTGRPDGRTPATLGVVIGLGFVGLNLLGGVLNLLVG
jgi:hypothetical protein